MMALTTDDTEGKLGSAGRDGDGGSTGNGGRGGTVLPRPETTPVTAFWAEVTTPSMSSVAAATNALDGAEGGVADGAGAGGVGVAGVPGGVGVGGVGVGGATGDGNCSWVGAEVRTAERGVRTGAVAAIAPVWDAGDAGWS
jgi:hypothetical protein